MRSIPRWLAVAAAGVGLCAAPLGAQSDEETLARYRLTEAAFAKFSQAARNLIAAAKADPATFREKEGDGDETAESIAELAAFYERHPTLKRAINAAGMTTREYTIFTLSMFEAGMAAFLVEQQGGTFDNVPAAVPRDNVLFFQRHQEELKRISAELRALEGQEEAPEFD